MSGSLLFEGVDFSFIIFLCVWGLRVACFGNLMGQILFKFFLTFFLNIFLTFFSIF